jgi:hypothetical protein
MIARIGARIALAALVVLAASPSPARAQLFMSDVPEFHLSASVFLSYSESWQRAHGQAFEDQRLLGGASLSLSGWIYESRWIKFRTNVLVLRHDDAPPRSMGYSLGYGASLSLFSRSILPVTLSYAHSLAVDGATVRASGVGSNTTYAANVQLVSPVLPRLEAHGQTSATEYTDGSRTRTDAVGASAFGESPLHRYSAVGSWQDQQVDGQGRFTTSLASVRDDAPLSKDTLASFTGSLVRSAGPNGPDDVYTTFSTSGSVLTRLRPETLLRGQYTFTDSGGAGREAKSGAGSLGATFDLRPVPLVLGEGLSASETRYLAPGLDQTTDAVVASQGIGTQGRWGTVGGSLSGSGQAGYATVSDGHAGPIYGFGLNGGLQWAVPRSPVDAHAFYSAREDRSSAGTSALLYGATVTSTVSRWYPVLLLPLLSYTHQAERSFFSESLGGSGGLAPPLTYSANDTFSASVTGMSPAYGTQLTFSSGYIDSSSSVSSAHVRQVFGRVGDAFRIGNGTFGNVTVDGRDELGQGSEVSALAALVWTFRGSTLSATYTYLRAFPAGSSTHTVMLLFTRSFAASFLPEYR